LIGGNSKHQQRASPARAPQWNGAPQREQQLSGRPFIALGF
jgi:hypothetical protein